MLDILKKVFGNEQETGDENDQSSGHDVRIAACALFLEMANIDDEFSENEQQEIIDILQSEFDLSREHAEALSEAAQAELDDSLDLWKFTNMINVNYSREEKIRVVELLWKVVYADGKLDKHENYLMHRFSRLLNLKHSELIDAKLAVLERRQDKKNG